MRQTAKIRTSLSSTALAFVAVGAFGALGAFGLSSGCGGTPVDGISSAQHLATIASCHLDDGSVDHDAKLHACDPHDTKKTTICHIPPGNPSNAHTICVGNAAVPAHLQNHGDYLGQCHNETPCPPPGGAGGSSGGEAGASGSGGAPPSPGVGGQSGGGAAGAGGGGSVPPVVP